MKCVKNNQTGAVKRCTDYSAENLVGPPGVKNPSGIYTYCPKSEWKALRTVAVTEATMTEEQSREATRKADKKKMQKDKRDYRKA